MSQVGELGPDCGANLPSDGGIQLVVTGMLLVVGMVCLMTGLWGTVRAMKTRQGALAQRLVGPMLVGISTGLLYQVRIAWVQDVRLSAAIAFGLGLILILITKRGHSASRKGKDGSMSSPSKR